MTRLPVTTQRLALSLCVLVLATGCFVAPSATPPATPGGKVEFAPAIDISRGEVHGVSSLDVGDINLDGRADVAVIEGGKHAVATSFSWWEAPAEGHDEWQRHDFNADARLRPFLGAARLADMDGDGDPDLVLSSDNHSGAARECDLYVLLNPLPDGSASSSWHPIPIAEDLAWHHVNDMEIADMDQDGKPDVVVRSLEPNAVHMFFQDDISQWTLVSLPTGLERSEGLAVGRLDSDAFPDIEFTGFILRAGADPRTERYRRIELDGQYHTVNQNSKDDIGDIDGDGDADVLLAPAEAYRGGPRSRPGMVQQSRRGPVGDVGEARCPGADQQHAHSPVGRHQRRRPAGHLRRDTLGRASHPCLLQSGIRTVR